jgi:hypothetical protein
LILRPGSTLYARHVNHHFKKYFAAAKGAAQIFALFAAYRLPLLKYLKCFLSCGYTFQPKYALSDAEAALSRIQA